MTIYTRTLTLALLVVGGGCFNPSDDSGVGADGTSAGETTQTSPTSLDTSAGTSSAGPTTAGGTGSGVTTQPGSEAGTDAGVTTAIDDESSSTGGESPADSSSSSANEDSSSSSSAVESDSSSGSAPDLPPDVMITMPAADLLGNNGLFYDGFDDTLGLYYADVNLAAVATDPEDGNISSDVTWTTDLTGIQSASLGTGGTVTVRLYSDDCFGVTHTITAAVIDSGNNAATSTPRQIFIFTIC